jgi:hypothetical protein
VASQERQALSVLRAITDLVNAPGTWREKRDAVLEGQEEEHQLEEFLAWEWPEEGANAFSPIEVVIAVALYGYNVRPGDRAQKLYAHFEGNCAEPEDLFEVLTRHVGYESTTFAFPTAEVYVRHALERYGQEARERVAANRLADRRHHG